MQTGAYDCGVFAIAYATDIAYSLDPASSLFRQGRMISVFECWQIDTISMEGNFNYTDLWDGEKG